MYKQILYEIYNFYKLTSSKFAAKSIYSLTYPLKNKKLKILPLTPLSKVLKTFIFSSVKVKSNKSIFDLILSGDELLGIITTSSCSK